MELSYHQTSNLETRVQLRCIKSILHEPTFILKYVNDLIVATKHMLVSSTKQ